MDDTIIIVGATETDQYGNLNVTCKDGNKIRVNKKHEGLHSLFEQGKAVKLHWETYQGKTYVADAIQVEGALPEPTKPPLADTDPPQVNVDTKIRSMALSYSKDMVVSGLVNLGDIGLVAMQLERYMLGFLDSKQLDANLKAILNK